MTQTCLKLVDVSNGAKPNNRPDLWNVSVLINQEFPQPVLYAATEVYRDSGSGKLTRRLAILRHGTQEAIEIIECDDLKWLYLTGRSLMRAALGREGLR